MHTPPADWARQSAWRVLDTGFGHDPRHFFRTWQAWRQARERPRVLHWVALCDAPAPGLAALHASGASPELVQVLAPQWFGLLPGWHRLLLDHGQVLLTLCIGAPLALLREQAFLADAIQLHAPGWDLHHFKALAALCRRGTYLSGADPLSDEAGKLLRQCGFDVTQQAPLQARFNPRWTLKHPAAESGLPPQAPSHCTVLGAGLAGASVAAALARRGVQVDVLDAAPEPASGASGLPVGLMAPQVSADDGPRARLSRAGLRLSLQQAQALLRPGDDWGASGVLERSLKSPAALPARWGRAGEDWSTLCGVGGPHPPGTAHLLEPPALWHHAGAWLKPAALVRAWLATEGVRFNGNQRVKRLQPAHSQWLLHGEQDQVLAQTPHLVLANAWGLPALAADWLPAKPQLSSVAGQVSWGLHRAGEAALPTCPVNGLGSFIPQVPQGASGTVGLQRAWFAGATFEHEALPVDAAHQANLARLAQLLPEAAGLLRAALQAGQAQAWRGTRCTSSDRLPLVGLLHRQAPADPAASDGAAALWASAAMGARGLSLSMLCAELVAARMCGEPLPVEASLARLLDARRGH